ncbi:prepilin-type N-terminal cleavage/methylation domain-containing protein [Pseudomonas sp. DCB_BI]|uniref:prepilin-type N-terminal cleavage/methylation domain-containing protein n=1 Tax=Pseudomonas sp. DCB_BI TaxID=2993594 RepID=UPI003A4D3C32
MIHRIHEAFSVPMGAGTPASAEVHFHQQRRCQPTKHRQTGLTLIELMVALALTAILGIMLAALVNGWLKVRERLQATPQHTSVLDFCLALERRLDSPVLRRIYDQRLPLTSHWLDWQPASNQLLWVASTGLPDAEGGARLQRQRLRFEAREQRLMLESSADLYAAAAPRWVLRERLDRVSAMNVLYYQGGRWLAWPSDQPAHPGRGVRLELQRDGAPYVCTFALPWGRS